ncbi:hypothetical protein, partial [Streptomyces sp. IBSBF 3010]|uniref:hypothetical protein n=1 Tax=Streptomyces sp. IBSBF 3010 TaxID=2903526 RepID=UPI002FDBB8CB
MQGRHRPADAYPRPIGETDLRTTRAISACSGASRRAPPSADQHAFWSTRPSVHAVAQEHAVRADVGGRP